MVEGTRVLLSQTLPDQLGVLQSAACLAIVKRYGVLPS
jgi:hypothetical protein